MRMTFKTPVGTYRNDDAPIAAALGFLAVWCAWFVYVLYVLACVLNHVGVWPFSYLGQG